MLLYFFCCHCFHVETSKQNLQVELWDIENSRKIMCLPQRCSANMTGHLTKKKGLSSLFTTPAIVVCFCSTKYHGGLYLVYVSSGNFSLSRTVNYLDLTSE